MTAIRWFFEWATIIVVAVTLAATGFATVLGFFYVRSLLWPESSAPPP